MITYTFEERGTKPLYELLYEKNPHGYYRRAS